MNDSLPVDSFKEAVPYLRRPFTAAAVKFKVQATWPKDNPTDGLVVAYIDQRLASERLNMVCPHLWNDAYEPTAQGLMWCHLTVDGITRSDVGEGQAKGLVSDALKRAAVKFGVGVSLYAVPQSFVSVSRGEAKQKSTHKGITIELTPKGEKEIRQAYQRWLDSHGSKVFGEPLDHGDVVGAQGDAETDDAVVAPSGPAPRSDVPADVTDLRGPQPAATKSQDTSDPLGNDEMFAVEMAGYMRQLELNEPQPFREFMSSMGVDLPSDLRAKDTRLGVLKGLTLEKALEITDALKKRMTEKEKAA